MHSTRCEEDIGKITDNRNQRIWNKALISNFWNMNTWVLNAASLQAHYTEAEASASSLFVNLWAPMAPDLNDEFK